MYAADLSEVRIEDTSGHIDGSEHDCVCRDRSHQTWREAAEVSLDATLVEVQLFSTIDHVFVFSLARV